MPHRMLKTRPIFTSISGTTHSVEFNVKDYIIICPDIGYNATYAGTVKVKGTFENSAADVDFTAAQSPTNKWFYVNMKEYIDDTLVKGDDGIVVTAGSAGCRGFEIDVNLLTYICFEVSAYTAGNATMDFRSVDNT